MTLHTPLFLQPSGADADITPTAQEFRRLIDQLFAKSGQCVLNGLNSPSTEFAVSQRGAGANFSVDITSGNAVISGDDITAQGMYFVWNDAVVNLATPTAPGSGTRIHRLVLQIRDKLSNGSFTTYDCVPLVVQDTGAGTPAEPASALTLAFITIAAGQVSVLNANIADKRTFMDDPWATATLQNGWSGTLQYRLAADRRSVKLSTTGLLTGGTITNDTVLTNLPSAYHPATGPKVITVGVDGTAPANGDPHVKVATNGNVTLRWLTTAASFGFEGEYAIDN